MDVFDRAAPDYGRVGPPLFEHFGQRITDIAGVLRGEACLDVATGTGAAIFPASVHAGPGALSVGIDLSESMLRRLREEAVARNLRQVHPIQMRAERLALGDATFDVALCGFALGSFQDAEGAMSEVRRVLRYGGRFALSVSDRWWFETDERWSWLERLLPSLGAHVHGRPPRFNDPELVRAILERHGFVRVSVAAEEFPLRFVDFDEWWRWGWSHAYRKILESLANPELDRYRIEAASHLERISPIEARLEVLIGIGTKL